METNTTTKKTPKAKPEGEDFFQAELDKKILTAKGNVAKFTLEVAQWEPEKSLGNKSLEAFNKAEEALKNAEETRDALINEKIERFAIQLQARESISLFNKTNKVKRIDKNMELWKGDQVGYKALKNRDQRRAIDQAIREELIPNRNIEKTEEGFICEKIAFRLSTVKNSKAWKVILTPSKEEETK